MKACVCNHGKGEHRNGKHWCLLCPCTRFEAHRPTVSVERQCQLFEADAHQRARIFDALREVANGARIGLTCDELAARTGIKRESVRGRLSEMASEGVIVESGLTRRVKGSARRATVYRIPPPPSSRPAAPPRVVDYVAHEDAQGNRIAVPVYERKAVLS